MTNNIRYPADPRKQNHYERWLAERAVQKDDNCGCSWCLEWDAEAARMNFVFKMDKIAETIPSVSKIPTPEPDHIKPSPRIMRQPASPSLGDAVATFSKRGRPQLPVTDDQQKVLDRTDLTIRQKAELSGLPVSTVGRLTKK